MPTSTPPSTHPDQQAFIAQRDVAFYFRVVRLPALLAMVLGSIAVVAETPIEVFWAVAVISFAWLGWRLVHSHQATLQQGLAAGTLAGALIGFVVAVVRLVKERVFFYFFNIVTDPILIGLLGAGVVALTIWILHQQILTITTSTKGGAKLNGRSQQKNRRQQ